MGDILRGAYEHAEVVTLPNGTVTDRQDLVVATFEVVKQGPAAGRVVQPARLRTCKCTRTW